MKIKRIILIYCLFILVGCAKKAEPCFSISKSAAKVKEEIIFDATCSANGNIYGWNFGDQTTGAGITTKHQYLFKGTYKVVFTVYNKAQKVASDEKTITVSQ